MPHPCHRVRLALLLAWPAERAAVAAANVVTPIGPFCPFRSAVCAENGPLGAAMSDLTSSKMPVFAAEMSRLQLEMSMGNEPDPKRVGALADDLIEAEQQWQRILTRMRLADDFQSREYFKVTAAWAIRQGQSLEAVGLMMRWQAENMKSFATGGKPLPPPPGVDLTQIAQQQQQGGGQSNMMAQMASASAVDATPFTGKEAAFESPVVVEEYEKLCRDHAAIVKLGEGFGGFDPLGKLAFIDALEAVEERWDVFFSRFALMGALNQDFVDQTTEFLRSMGMSPDDFRDVLCEAHALMRKDAETERASM